MKRILKILGSIFFVVLLFSLYKFSSYDPGPTKCGTGLLLWFYLGSISFLSTSVFYIASIICK